MDFLSALPDMEAALRWATARMGAPVLLWGSSYSAALVFELAARHPHEVAGIIAFSPAEYVTQRPHLVRDAARRVRIPVYITSSPVEATRARNVYLALPGPARTLCIPRVSEVHASSVLRPDRAGNAGALEAWRGLRPFLSRYCRARDLP